MIKKIILSILASLVLFLSVAPNFMLAHAQSGAPPVANTAPSPAPASWYNQGFQDWYSKVYDDTNSDEIFGERYTAAQVQWVIYGLFAFIINSTSNAEVLNCILKSSSNLASCKDLISTRIEPNIAASTEKNQGSSLLSQVFEERSFSGISYIKNTANNFSLVPTAHAQSTGFGFDALVPIQDMWRASRDMAFGLFVVVAIVFSFMIMFRVKISPQVIISVQSSIPKLIISLVLVTFSYAIAGLLIDLMYVVYGIISVMGTGFVPSGTATPAGVFAFLTRGELGMSNAGGPDLGAFGLFALYCILFPMVFLWILVSTLGILVSAVVVAIPILVIGGTLGSVMGWIGIAILAIVIIMTIWNGIKIIWSLMKAFANILLLTIFAPIQIVAGTIIPNLGFGSWIKSFVSNLAVFIVTSVLFLFAYVFLTIAFSLPSNLDAWSDLSVALWGTALSNRFGADSTNGWPPLFESGQGWMAFLFLGVSFIMFTLIPKATEVIQGLISGRPFAYGTAIGEAFGFVPRDVKGAVGSTIGAGVATRAGRIIDRYGGDTDTGKAVKKWLDAYSEGYFRGKPGVKGPGER